MNKKEVVVVLGYGCHLKPKIKQYLDEVATFLKKREDPLVIFTGGYTNKRTMPWISESGMMAEYLKERMPFFHFILDEEARTTNENIDGVRRILNEYCPDPETIFIFCEYYRRFKVMALAKRQLKNSRIVVMPFDFGPRSFKSFIKQVMIATPLCVLSAYLPFLKKFEIMLRERKMNKS